MAKDVFICEEHYNDTMKIKYKEGVCDICKLEQLQSENELLKEQIKIEKKINNDWKQENMKLKEQNDILQKALLEEIHKDD